MSYKESSLVFFKIILTKILKPGYLNSLLMRMKEESEKKKKTGLKLNIKKIKIMTSSSITSWQIEVGKVGAVTRFSFLGLQNHCRWWLQS